jgi:glycine cleavage system H protein
MHNPRHDSNRVAIRWRVVPKNLQQTLALANAATDFEAPVFATPIGTQTEISSETQQEMQKKQKMISLFEAVVPFYDYCFMSKVPPDLKYTKSHEWVRVAGDTATVGITDHAQRELTDIVFLELPSVGDKVKAGDACAVVESVKTASDIYSPLSGQIVEANKPVVEDPAQVNSEPYGAGWFYKIKLSHPAELDALLTPKEYAAQIKPK